MTSSKYPKQTIVGQMPIASDSRTGHVSIIDMRNSLNIHFTGIHALGDLFSVIFYEKIN